MARINYPATWDQADRDELDKLFTIARRDRLWFFHGGLSGPLWFSPNQLEAEQKNGKFVWGAVNWALRDPQEHLNEAVQHRKAAEAEEIRIATLIGKR